MNSLPVFANRNGVLSEEQLVEIQRWQQGTKLRGVVESEAWEILLDTLSSYVEQADLDLRNLPPGSPEVVTAHAALSALHQGFKLFKEDIEASVEASKTIPEALKDTVQGI